MFTATNWNAQPGRTYDIDLDPRVGDDPLDLLIALDDAIESGDSDAIDAAMVALGR